MDDVRGLGGKDLVAAMENRQGAIFDDTIFHRVLDDCRRFGYVRALCLKLGAAVNNVLQAFFRVRFEIDLKVRLDLPDDSL